MVSIETGFAVIVLSKIGMLHIREMIKGKIMADTITSADLQAMRMLQEQIRCTQTGLTIVNDRLAGKSGPWHASLDLLPQILRLASEAVENSITLINANASKPVVLPLAHSDGAAAFAGYVDERVVERIAPDTDWYLVSTE